MENLVQMLNIDYHEYFKDSPLFKFNERTSTRRSKTSKDFLARCNNLIKELKYLPKDSKWKEKYSNLNEYNQAMLNNVKENHHGNCSEFAFLGADILREMGKESIILYIRASLKID